MFFGINHHRFHITARVVVLIDHTPFLKLAWSFNYPIFYLFMVETTFVTNEFIYFVVFVFSACHSLNFVAEHPKRSFSATFITISVSIKRLIEPNSRLETEGLIC